MRSGATCTVGPETDGAGAIPAASMRGDRPRASSPSRFACELVVWHRSHERNCTRVPREIRRMQSGLHGSSGSSVRFRGRRKPLAQGQSTGKRLDDPLSPILTKHALAQASDESQDVHHHRFDFKQGARIVCVHLAEHVLSTRRSLARACVTPDRQTRLTRMPAGLHSGCRFESRRVQTRSSAEEHSSRETRVRLAFLVV